jgi:serine/threonine protein phosphatase PrpC
MSEPAKLRSTTGAGTHEGRVRDHNEDSWFAAEEQGLWAVADGMGGHEGGEWASAVVVDQLRELALDGAFDDCCEQIAEAIHTANRLIFAEALKRGKQMGTTAVVLFVRGRRFAVLWVGDSRAYLLRDGVLHQISKDHTQVQEMLDRGLLDPSEAEKHPMRHILARAVGVTDAMEVDAIVDDIEAGDTFLLSSDGLHCCVGQNDIRSILGGPSPDAIAAKLVEMSLDHGAPDNVTVVAVRFREATLLDVTQPVDSQ